MQVAAGRLLRTSAHRGQKTVHLLHLWLFGANADPQWTIDRPSGCSPLRRSVAHEAGHALCGHLVGLDLTSYWVAGTGDGEAAVQFDLDSASHDITQPHVLQALAVAAMGGMAAEMLICGDHEGGAADMAKISELVSDAASTEDWIVNSTSIAVEMLKNHHVEFETLVSRIGAGAAVEACVAAASQATTTHWYSHVAARYPHVRGREAGVT